MSRGFLVFVALAFAVLAKGQARETPFVPPKRWAMVVGAGNYTEYGKLNYAAKDAKIFAKTLIDNFRFSPDTVELITDDADSNQKPDAATIKAALDRQIGDKRLNKGDLFIFYFAGHGLGTPRGDLLLPTDATKQNAVQVGQPVKEIVDMFVKAGLRNVLIIADACREGEKNEFGEELQELGRKANIAVMLGCAPGARSYEYPQLGHGVFTSFLVKTLKSKELRNPLSGALWASNVIHEVSNKVREYTVRDYPNSPQAPMGWSDKTQDVLLAAYPTKDALSAFKDQAGELTRDKYMAAVIEMAAALIEERRHEDAIELLKTLDSVDRLSPQVLFLFGYSLAETGRLGEGARIFKRLTETGDPIFGSIATIVNPSREVLAEQKVKACLDLWKLDKSYETALLIWQTLRFKANLAVQTQFLNGACVFLESWQRMAFQGELAAVKGYWSAGIASFQQSLAQCEDPRSRRMLKLMMLPTLMNADRIAASDPLFKELESESDIRASVLICRAGIAKRQRHPNLVPELLNQALDAEPDPGNILTCMIVGTDSLPSIAAKVKREAAKHPYAWEAIVASGLISLLVEGKHDEFVKSLQTAEKYCDDSLSINARAGRILLDVASNSYQAGVIDSQTYLRLANGVFISLLPNVSKFVEDYEVWQVFTFAALGTGRQAQLATVIEKYLGPAIRSGNLDREIRPYCLLAFMNAGQDDLVLRLTELGGIVPSDAADYAFMTALYSALKSGTKSNLPARDRLSLEMRPFYDALSLYQDPKVSKAKLDKFDVSNPVSKTLIGLAYLRLGDSKKGLSLLKASLENQALGFTFVEALTRQRLFLEMVKAKRIAEANEVLYTGLLTQFVNPIYRGLSLGVPPAGTSRYNVTIRLDAYTEDGLQYQLSGKITLTVGKQLKGEIVLADGTKASLLGTADRNGNVTGTFELLGDTYTLTGKLASSKDAGPVFQALDSDFRRLVILTHPRE